MAGQTQIYESSDKQYCFGGHAMSEVELKSALAGRGFTPDETTAFIKVLKQERVAYEKGSYPELPKYDLEAWKTEYREKEAAAKTEKLKADAQANIANKIPLSITATVNWGAIHYDVNMTVDSVGELVEQIKRLVPPGAIAF